MQSVSNAAYFSLRGASWCLLALFLLLNASGAAAELTAADRERLRQLGYLDYAEEKAEGGHGVVINDHRRAYPGYNLHVAGSTCRAELLDMDGRVIHSWHPGPCLSLSNPKILADGDLLLTGISVGDKSTREYVDKMFIQRLSWDGKVRWKRFLPAHHDAHVMPDGRIFTLTKQYRRIPAVDPKVDVIDNSVVLLSSEGELLEAVSVYDLFQSAPEIVSLSSVPARERDGEPEIDLIHGNTIEWISAAKGLRGKHPIYRDGNLLLCLREQDIVAVVDWNAKKIIWAWGKGTLSRPHHPTLLENGHILVFDNGVTRRSSRVLELDPLTGKIVWQYPGAGDKPFFTRSRGANQRLKNGNTLITNSDNGIAFEVTHDGDVVWKFQTPHLNEEGHRATIERMPRYERSFIDLLLLRDEE